MSENLRGNFLDSRCSLRSRRL